ncbi:MULTISPECIES: hydrogenase expression/formation protein HypE [unclassified Campylobacter]|uniref:hydrogenase expression/formation protein HypE n=1 Tax=unclassified Campylobacter TaxID=2593542 RepID=UPI001BDABC13|nr:MULTISPECIES: hydrogenase expression/formation protein HypE [unclassified Campylobacter]MBT0881102.1 hydrogenase expression/formation protein HypE [Campylobacter sp. 2018MI27]MBT0884185.1 hydrogenase expression/formation protein HypE [Campylobacter sp. 2018MI10]
MQKQVLLSYGGGGDEMNEFLNNFILKHIHADNSQGLSEDAAVCDGFSKIAFSTDSFVLDPIFINGANIGKIAACGSINDVLMMGAKPKYLTLGLILEEGFLLDDLAKILNDLSNTAKEFEVGIKCGDLKVVPKGKADKIYINTTCIGDANGFINNNKISTKNIKEGDAIIVSGDLGRHGACVMAARFGFNYDIMSDAKCLYNEVKDILKYDIKCLRDATRGGLSSVLNELAKSSGLEFIINESDISISDGVLGLCELLGFDALELANEGTFVCICSKEDAQNVLKELKKYNDFANIIGVVHKSKSPSVKLNNSYGGSRILQMPKGELLPRIC